MKGILKKKPTNHRKRVHFHPSIPEKNSKPGNEVKMTQHLGLELFQLYSTLCTRKKIHPWEKLLQQIKVFLFFLFLFFFLSFFFLSFFFC